MKNNKLLIGLLSVVAVALIINAYLLATDGGSAVGTANPTDAKATFERKATTAAEARKDALDAANAINPVSNNEQLARAERGERNKADEMPKQPQGPLTGIRFDQSAHDFGTIMQDTENKKIFKFTNTGKEPLIIENAKGSCGCTVPKYPKEPIAPGGTGEIEVVYKPGKQKNQQTKNITITANTDPANTVLTISANVLEVEG